MTLPPFYQIVDDARWLERFVPLGLELVQLRLKDLPPAEVRAQVRAAREICGTGCQLVVNDHWEIALDEGCGFVHLGQEDLDTADLDAIHAAAVRLGVSTHDPAELDRGLSVGPAYVALGPVWPTILKQMKWAPQGVDRVSESKALVAPLPLVAIGGLTVERAPAVWAAGADTICVVTEVLRHPEPEARLAEWLALARSRVMPPV